MVDLLQLQKQFILTHLKEGDTAVDYTMGNGHDTAFLSQVVGATGKVYAFDVQPQALENTKKRLEQSECPLNYTLILDSHHRVQTYVQEPVKAGMFNLGYMPGNGNKEFTTKRETTLPAVQAAIELIAPDGILLIAVYPGHAEGEAEGLMLQEYLAALDRRRICVSKFQILNSPTSPYFMILEKK